ncbi:MAG: hypothetical protein U0132_00060, partial [Gemmatimonadaceae bacterium]
TEKALEHVLHVKSPDTAETVRQECLAKNVPNANSSRQLPPLTREESTPASNGVGSRPAKSRSERHWVFPARHYLTRPLFVDSE